MAINEKIIAIAGDLLTKQMQEYLSDIDRAYCVEDALNIGLGVKLSPGTDGVKVETSINFVTERVKDRAVVTVDDRQLLLWGER